MNQKFDFDFHWNSIDS